MLLGQLEPPSAGAWIGIAGVVTSIITAAGSAYILYRKDQREDRKDVINECFQTIADLRTELKATKDELHTVRNETNTRILDLYGKHEACQAENRQMKAENERMAAELVSLREAVNRKADR